VPRPCRGVPQRFERAAGLKRERNNDRAFLRHLNERRLPTIREPSDSRGPSAPIVIEIDKVGFAAIGEALAQTRVASRVSRPQAAKARRVSSIERQMAGGVPSASSASRIASWSGESRPAAGFTSMK
jgi:hypothetical protein